MSNDKKPEKKLPIDKEEYDRLVNECLQIIKEKKIFFITDLVAFLPFNRSMYYFYQLDKSDTLKDAINDNKIQAKQVCKAKWFYSDNATLQIAFYKLIATDEEREILRNNPKQEVINIPTQEKTQTPLQNLFFKNEKDEKIDLGKL